MAVGWRSGNKGTFAASVASYTVNLDTSGGRAAGVIFAVTFANAGASIFTGATIGGTNAPEVTGGNASDAAGEPGHVKAYFLDNITQGASVAFTATRTNNTVVAGIYALCFSTAAAAEAFAVALLEGDGAYAEQSIDDGSPGTNSLRAACGYYGGATPQPVGAATTIVGSTQDQTAFGCNCGRETTAGQGARNVGFTQVTSDDRAAVHLAVREIPVVVSNYVGLPARDFDGTDDFVTLATGGLADLDGGPITIVAVVRLDATVDGGVLWAGSTSAAADRRFCLECATGTWFYDTSSGNFQSLFSGSVGENWTLIAVTKADGTTTPRGHKYVYDTGVWIHVNAGGTLVDAGSGPGSGGVLQIGRSATAEWFDGKIAAVGVWRQVLPDGLIETLPYAIQQWRQLAPNALWTLDQPHEGLPLLDAGGGANQTAIAGTTVARDRPAALSFAAPELPPVLPAAPAAPPAFVPAIESQYGGYY